MARQLRHVHLENVARNLGYRATGEDLPQECYTHDDDDSWSISLKDVAAEMHLRRATHPEEFEGVNQVDSPTTLYRFFDEKGMLLYVGVSVSAPNRLRQHNRDKPWFSLVSSATFSHFATRQEALRAEAIAIRTEKPLMNVVIPMPWFGTDEPKGLTDEQKASFGKQTRRYFDMPMDEFVEAWRDGEIDRDDERLRFVANFLGLVGSGNPS
jgi:predicted GIY-YIG superfamily endonuclease